MKNTFSIVIFSGGRGCADLIKTFSKHAQIRISVLLNAYDDGLSTGRLRKLIPGMLGPSDVRKNVAHFIEDSQPLLAKLLEYRLPETIPTPVALTFLEELAKDLKSSVVPGFDELIDNLKYHQAKTLQHFVKCFLNETSNENLMSFDFGDCSFGNVLFAGCFYESQRDFNKCVSNFSLFAGIEHDVVNVTKGENYILCAIKEDGSLLWNEAEIVSKQSDSLIKEIFLLENYLSQNEIDHFRNLKSLEEKIAFLSSRQRFPLLNNEAAQKITNADVIIYGPGTQHSSLFPSYMTVGLGESIANNVRADKIFISNILVDNEIQKETVHSIIEKLFFYLNEKNRLQLDRGLLVTKFFLQRFQPGQGSNKQYIPLDEKNLISDIDKFVVTDWESGTGKHHAGRVLDELTALINSRIEKAMKPYVHQVSIVVPVLNEIKTIESVISQLKKIDLQPLGVSKEIIVVDGGSTDGSWEKIANFDSVIKLKNQFSFGRGGAIRTGIENAKGNIVVTFPGDGEYPVNDIYKIISTLMDQEFAVVFGSRAIKCVDLSGRIKGIYKGQWLLYLTSKWGGMLLSLMTLVLYNRFVTDPLTSVRAFNTRLIRSLNLKCSGVDLDMEITAKVCRKQLYILEVPVDYTPRTRAQGKKITLFDGLSCVWTLWRLRRWKDNKAHV